EREHWALTTLAGLPTVPALGDYRDGHEHRFLPREFVEGEALIDVLRRRHPFTSGQDSPEVRAAYTAWALDILDQVARGVADMHRRGVVFGDLHPGNILVKADNTVAFIDMETCTPVEAGYQQAMGALGFHAPHHLTGPAVDLFALNVLRLTMFMPLPQVVPWGVAKVRTLLEAATEHFDLPESLTRAIADGLGPEVLTGDRDFRADWPANPGPGLREAIARSIVEAASPERDDRLYPGDAMQFLVPDGGTTFAYGAAGVLWALSRTGHRPPAEHVQWLADHARDAETDGPGFYTGLAGLAYTLDHLGRPEEADAVMRRAFATPAANVSDSLCNGWSGLGLVALHLAERRGDAAYLEMARTLAGRLGGPESAPAGPKRVGLVHGRTGHALFLLRLFEHTGDVRHLDAAEAELRGDLDTIDLDQEDSRLRLGPGLIGSAGLRLVIRAFPRDRPRACLAAARPRRRAAVHTGRGRSGGLSPGRAGLGGHGGRAGPRGLPRRPRLPALHRPGDRLGRCPAGPGRAGRRRHHRTPLPGRHPGARLRGGGLMIDVPRTLAPAAGVATRYSLVPPRGGNPLWSTAVALAPVAGADGAEVPLSALVAGANGHSRADALLRGAGEAVERRALHPDDRLGTVRGTAAGLGRPALAAHDPRNALAHPDAARAELDWYPATRLSDAATVLVPAPLVD